MQYSFLGSLAISLPALWTNEWASGHCCNHLPGHDKSADFDGLWDIAGIPHCIPHCVVIENTSSSSTDF